MNEHDEKERLDALARLYGRLTPPPLADGLEQVDAETARAVHWMRTAWQGLALPEPVLPLPRVARRSRRRAWARVPWLAAAGVLALGAALLWRARRAPSEGRREQRVSAADVSIEDVRPGRLELRSGPVRLLLLDAPERDPKVPDPDSTGG